MDLYFDFLSPYAYLASRRAAALCAQYDEPLVLRPVLLAGILKHWGQLGPAEVPPKREHLLRELLRYTARHNVPFALPAVHPFNPLTALRACLPVVAGDHQARIADAIWQAGWVRGEDLGDAQVIAAALNDLGLDGAALVARTRAPEVKQALVAQTQQAIDRGVFGVPTMYCRDELFWGNDRLDDVQSVLAGTDPLDRERLAALRDHPMAHRRRGTS